MRVTNEGPIRPLTESVTGIGGSTTPPEDCCDVEPDDLPDEAANEDGLGPQSAWVLEEIPDGTPTDQNVAHGTVSNGSGATVGWANPTNSNDGNSGTYAGINSGVYGTGTFTGYLVSDLGTAYDIAEHIFTGVSASGTDGLQAFGTWTVQYGPDGSTWNETGVTPTGGGAGVTTPVVFTLPSPVSARYWRAKMVMVTTGFHQGFELHTWAINGEGTLGEAWSLPAPEVIDVDDATYVEVDGPLVVRIDLGSEKTIARSRLRIGTATAGAKTYNIDAWNEEDESDRVTLATFNFTGTGSLTAQDVVTTWFNVTPYEWYELDGNDEDRRIFSWELYGATLATNHQHDASTIAYDNTASGLTGDTVQEAIDELATTVITEITDIPTVETDTTLVLAPDGAGGVEFRAETGGGGGGWVLLEQHTASSSATLDFTACLTSTYDRYMIELVNLIPATNNVQPYLRYSTNAGSSYIATGYHWLHWFFYGGGSQGTENSTSDVGIAIGGAAVSSSGDGVWGTIHVYNPLRSGTTTKSVSMDTFRGHTSVGTVHDFAGSGDLVVAPVDALRILFSSGNIASGIARVYGLVK